MDKLDELYEDAEKHHVTVIGCPLESAKSLIADLGNGEAAIGLNIRAIRCREEATELFAHELGHYHTGTYYQLSSTLGLRGKMEYKADVWAVKQLVPIDRLKQALSENYLEYWELADYFDCSEKLIRRAVEIYREKGLL